MQNIRLLSTSFTHTNTETIKCSFQTSNSNVSVKQYLSTNRENVVRLTFMQPSTAVLWTFLTDRVHLGFAAICSL